MLAGWIILDKPSGVFSRTAGARVARMFGEKTFGHIGTLDPMASGVLPIAIGAATKMIPFVEEIRSTVKEYLFSLQFGFETDTLDITGKEIKRTDIIPDKESVLSILPKLIGDIEQIPPIYSAVHIDGKRAYELARQGRVVENMVPRQVRIESLDLVEIDGNSWVFRTRCSRGTYVRSIARDIAKLCGTVATVDMIRRTESIGFGIKDTVQLDFLENLFNNNADFKGYLKPADFGLGDIPVQNLDNKQAVLYKNGGFIETGGQDGMRRVYSGSEFIGVGVITGGVLRPKRTI